MKYDEAQSIVINSREQAFRNDATIFAEQIAGDDGLNAALLRFHCAVEDYEVDSATCDISTEIVRIQTHYSTHNIDEEVGLFLIDNGGRKDELGNWL